MKPKFTIFLQNVDDSITKLKLKYGLSIASLSQPDADEFVKNLERCSINEAGKEGHEGLLNKLDTLGFGQSIEG